MYLHLDINWFSMHNFPTYFNKTHHHDLRNMGRHCLILFQNSLASSTLQICFGEYLPLIIKCSVGNLVPAATSSTWPLPQHTHAVPIGTILDSLKLTTTFHKFQTSAFPMSSPWSQYLQMFEWHNFLLGDKTVQIQVTLVMALPTMGQYCF